MRTHQCRGCHDVHCTCEPDPLEGDIVKKGLIRLAELHQEIERKEKEAALLLKDIQASCSHPEREIVEGDMRDYIYLDTCDPPFRVCKICGYNEPGWSCGYFLLAPQSYKIPIIKSDEASKFVRGARMSAETKSALFQERWDRERQRQQKETENGKGQETQEEQNI